MFNACFGVLSLVGAGGLHYVQNMTGAAIPGLVYVVCVCSRWLPMWVGGSGVVKQSVLALGCSQQWALLRASCVKVDVV
jgi:hypothetical protein